MSEIIKVKTTANLVRMGLNSLEKAIQLFNQALNDAENIEASEIVESVILFAMDDELTSQSITEINIDKFRGILNEELDLALEKLEDLEEDDEEDDE